MPYSGCTVDVPFLPGREIDILALVISTTSYNLKMHVCAGTNIIGKCNDCDQNNAPKERENAFISLRQSRI